MDFKVGLTDEAIADLGGIVEFIARESRDVAARVGEELLATAESLGELPSRGSPVKGRPHLRKIFRWRFVIYYRVREAEKVVDVLRIWDASQAPWNLNFPE
jgi:plasmid stabilization system protein ParE